MERLVGHLFQSKGAVPVPGHPECQYGRFSLPCDARAEFVERFSFVLAAAYAPPGMRLDPRNRPDLPTAANIRKGDFGEALAAILYDQALSGFEVPASKLWLKPNPNTSQTGEDNVVVSVRGGEKSKPVTIESKVRTGKPGPATLLGLFEQPTHDRSPTRRAAWQRAADALRSLPKHQIELAYLLAYLMERESNPDFPQPSYESHGFLVCEPGALSDSGISSRWRMRVDLPITRLVIVEIADIDDLVGAVFERACDHTVRDLAPHPDDLAIESEEVALGFSAPLAIDLRHPPAIDCVISRSALWYLTDRDGLGAAAASEARYDDDPATRVLASLLMGMAPDEDDVSLSEIGQFVQAVMRAWWSPRASAEADKEVIRAATTTTAGAETVARTQLTAEAVAYRLDRHPYRLVPPHLRCNAVLATAIKQFVKNQVVALWPAQAEVLSHGLLQDPVGPFVVQLATSAGKTLLIALSCAVALDQRPHRQVVVVASTRALVRQLGRELRKWLPETSIVPVLGEIEFSGANCFPDNGAPGRVVITTPERLDLDWRRAITESTPIHVQQWVSLIVADEAHLLSDSARGPRLEAVLARALRHDIPIQLFSSQLGDLEQLSGWLAAVPAESKWRPADVRCSAFYRSEDESRGFLMRSNREVELCMTMAGGKWDQSDPSFARISSVSSMAAGLALSRYQAGMVLLYTAQKRWAPSVASAVVERADDCWRPDPDLVDIADRLPPACGECADLLRRGIGVHHASCTAFEQRAVEDAARRGLLRYLVCTDTLLAGVDFPIRTVIVVHSFRGQGVSLSASDLRNLAGRAGRGGRFSTGEFIVITTTEAKADSMLHKLADYEPPLTASQFGNAICLIESYRGDLDLPLEHSRDLRDLDAFLLRAVTEAALRQGDLRLELEETLERTLWWASAPADRREALLDAAGERAEALGSPVVPRGWNRVVYRTGLDRGTCNALRAMLDQIELSEFESFAELAETIPEEPESMLMQLALVATYVSPVERSWPAGLASDEDRESTIRLWFSGGEAKPPDSKSISSAFEYLERYAPWVVGASIEIIGWMHDLDASELSRIHTNLGLDRLRFGAPSVDAAQLVSRGLPRTEAADLWRRYRGSATVLAFRDYARAKLDPRTVELLRISDPSGESGFDEWSPTLPVPSTDLWHPAATSPF